MKVNHGANLYDLSIELGFSKNDFMDFSSNINPLGASSNAKNHVINNIDSISIYPDPSYFDLKGAISTYCNCSSDNIILGNGATELISSFIKTLRPQKSLLLSPVYSEFESELRKINSSIIKFFHDKSKNFTVDINDLIDILNKDKYDLLVICNPNNPTGFAFTNLEIKKLLESTSTYVMIDETYIEFTDMNKYSATSLVDEFDNLFVIRGTSKFFSTPGIRLGYSLLSNRDLFDKISSKFDLWNINILASMMGEVMFLDNDFIDNSFDFVTNERDYLVDELSKFDDFYVYNTHGNFILCEIKSRKFTSNTLREFLLTKKIIIRDCSSFDGLDEYFFRVCVLSSDANRYLIECINNFI